jgi:pimeloyl-ACP methyl ester carboxylesterase
MIVRMPEPLPYDELGSGPPVVLLHAGVADRTMWSELQPELAAAGYRAIALDLPGFGDAPAEPGRAPHDAVLETLDALGIEQAAVVGLSFGGAVALRIAALAPQRIGTLLLVSTPPPLDPSAELEAAWEAEESALARGDIDAAVAAVVDAWTLPDAPAPLRERVAAMQRRAFELQDARADGAANGPVAEPDDPLDADPEAFAAFAGPALVVSGEHDMVDFRDGADWIAARLPNARVSQIAGARHLAPLEQPDSFRALILEHLRTNGPRQI